MSELVMCWCAPIPEMGKGDLLFVHFPAQKCMKMKKMTGGGGGGGHL